MKVQGSMTTRTIVYLVCQVLLQGISFLLAPVYTRLLTTTDYGVASVFMVSVSLLSLFIGLQTHGSLNNARIEFSAEEQPAYHASILSLSFLSFVGILGVFVIFREPLSLLLKLPSTLVFLLVVTAFGAYCIQFISASFTVNKKSVAYLSLSVAVAVLTAVLSITMILGMDTSRYLGKIGGSAATTIFFGLLIFAAVMVRGRTFYNRRFWSFCLPLTLPLILHGAAGQILAQSDRLMLNVISGSSVAGIYSFCYTVALPLNAIWAALNSTWVPQFYDHMQNKSVALMHSQSRNYNFFFTCLTIGFILVSPEVVKILAPQDYWVGIPIVPMVALSYYFVFLYSFPGNHQFYLCKTLWISLASGAAALGNIILNFILIPTYGMMGAAWATLAAYILLFLVHELVARFVVKGYTYTLSFYLKGLAAVLLVTGVTYLLMEIWMARWVLGAIVGIILMIRLNRNKGIF